MRSVRCDACGTKALTAASKCPKCGHAFEVRDGFGELLPLSHCTSCDSYYPQHLGHCKWCGTKPERSPIGPLGPYIWKGVGILTFVSLAVGAWLAKNDTGSPATKPAPRTFVADTLPTNQPKAQSFGRKVALAQPDTATRTIDSAGALAVADSTRGTVVGVAATDSTELRSTPVVATEPVSMQATGSVATDSATAAETPPAEPPALSITRPAAPARVPDRTLDRSVDRRVTKAPSRALVRVPERAAPKKPARTPRVTATTPPARAVAKAPVRTTPKSTARSSKGGRWVTSVARNWAVVRSDPTRQARIIAAIGPNTRVQLGETRGEWRRIKAKGLAGWVEHRRLVVRAYAPARAGRLAAR